MLAPAAAPPPAADGARRQVLTEALASVPAAGQKQMVGEWLFPLLRGMRQVADPAKVTGMLLELEIGQLLDCLESPQMLQAAVTAALEALGVPASEAGPAAAPAKPAPPHKPPAEQKPRKSHVAPTNSKTRLCKYWIQAGWCKHGDTCDFAHSMLDMPQQAMERQQSKIKVASLGFKPLQAMGGTKRASSP